MKRLSDALGKIWDGDCEDSGLHRLYLLLRLLEYPYKILVFLRNFLYDNTMLRCGKLACPVISVGNITTGGTGKTPLVIMLARRLKEEGYRPAVLSRGYGGKSSKPFTVVSDGCTTLAGYREAGDEPVLISRRLEDVHIPVIVGARREISGEQAIKKFGANVIILDDGFQYRKLFRTLDIVLMDERRPVGNGRILPAGCLREPLRGLRRADILVLTGTGQDAPAGHVNLLPHGVRNHPHVFYSYHKPSGIMQGRGNAVLPVDSLKGRKIFAFAGIGRPADFCRTLEGMQAVIVGFSAFADHHAFTGQDLKIIKEQAERFRAELIVTTEKDAVRLYDFPDFLDQLFIICIDTSFLPDNNEFSNLVVKELNAAAGLQQRTGIRDRTDRSLS